MVLKFLAGAFAGLITIQSAGGQPSPARGTIQGIVVDSTGVVVRSAEIQLTDLGRYTQTVSAGWYRFDSVMPGSHALVARKLGFRAVTLSLQVLPNDVTYADLVMKPMTTILTPVLTIERGSPTAPAGFLQRMASAQGTYFTDADIAKLRPHRVSDLMRRIPGLKLFPNGEVFSSRGIVTLKTESCAHGMPIFVDNVQVGGGTMGDPESFTDRAMNRKPDFMSPTATGRSPIDGLRPGDIVGIEIYNGPATTPSTVSGTNSSCGAILIWTK